MPRVRNAPPAPPSLPPPNRSFVLVSEEVFRHYHSRRVEIGREWTSAGVDPSDPAAMDQVAMMSRARAMARADLRADVREMHARGHVGPYLIPV